MSGNHGCAHARSDQAVTWIDVEIESRDGEAVATGSYGRPGAPPPGKSSELDLFSREFVVAAWHAGFEASEDEVESSLAEAQRQLDDAAVLMRETAELLRGYEAHHRDEASKTDTGPARSERDRKADVNRLVAERLEAWLRGDDANPTKAEPVAASPVAPEPDWRQTTLGGPCVHCGAYKRQRHAADCPTQHLHNADGSSLRAVGDPELLAGLADEFATAAIVERPNVPLLDADIVDALRASFATPDRVDEAPEAFRLSTADPRFDPHAPLCVNGFLFLPTKES